MAETDTSDQLAGADTPEVKGRLNTSQNQSNRGGESHGVSVLGPTIPAIYS